jgi:hypothetical protein
MRSEFPLQQREHAKPNVETPVMTPACCGRSISSPYQTADSLSLFTLLSLVGLLFV